MARYGDVMVCTTKLICIYILTHLGRVARVLTRMQNYLSISESFNNELYFNGIRVINDFVDRKLVGTLIN